MRNLISAHLLRLRHSACFAGCLTLMAALALMIHAAWQIDAAKTGMPAPLDVTLFAGAPLSLVPIGVCCAMVIGAEYGDHTMRNMLIAGHARADVYLSNLVVCTLAALAMLAAYLIPYLLIGVPLLGWPDAPAAELLAYGLAVAMLAVAAASLFTMAAMLIPSRATGAVVCTVGAFGLLIAGLWLMGMLAQPPTVPHLDMGADGAVEVIATVPNSAYLNGPGRVVAQTLLDLLPGGQALQCYQRQAVNLPWLPVWSCVVTLVSSGAGLAVFRRQDLQ